MSALLQSIQDDIEQLQSVSYCSGFTEYIEVLIDTLTRATTVQLQGQCVQYLFTYYNVIRLLMENID